MMEHYCTKHGEPMGAFDTCDDFKPHASTVPVCDYCAHCDYRRVPRGHEDTPTKPAARAGETEARDA